MPNKCVVPGCRSNYSSEGKQYVRVFKFPNCNDLKQKWIKAIRREGWTPSRHSVVCIKHFSESAISRMDRYKTTNGNWEHFIRSCPALVFEAVPQIFDLKSNHPIRNKRDKNNTLRKSKRQRKNTEKKGKKYLMLDPKVNIDTDEIKREVVEDPLFEEEIDIPISMEGDYLTDEKDPLEIDEKDLNEMKNDENVIIKHEKVSNCDIDRSLIIKSELQLPELVIEDNDGDQNIQKEEFQLENGIKKEESTEIILTEPVQNITEETFDCNDSFQIRSLTPPSFTMVRGVLKPRVTCNICQRSFSRQDKLTGHIRTHTGERPFSCGICNRTFALSSTLKYHLRIHNNDKRYHCDFCGKRFIKHDSLKLHVRTHTNEKPYSCKICCKTFIQSSSLKSHLRSHMNEKAYSCELCQKSFNHLCSLKYHMRTHTEDKPFSCNICFKKFILSSSLKSHLLIHTNEKPYSCEICKKAFNQSSHLKSHMYIHTKEKRYGCEFCDKRFTALASLKSHLRVHTKEKPYSCKVCNKEFSQLTSLNRHLLLHTNKKSFSCEFCKKTFKKSSLLKIHLRLHASEKLNSCQS